MLPPERQQKILDLIEQKSFAKVSELCRIFKATPPTIRKDLAILAEHQKVLPIWGGATIFPNTPSNIPLLNRKKFMQNEKKIIAKNIVDALPANSIIFMDTSTTTLAIAKYLAHSSHKKITVITNFLDIAITLSNANHIKLILCGGEMKKNHDFFDIETILCLKSRDADIAIISCHGVSKELGFLNKSPDSTTVKKIMISRSEQTWVCADHSKLDKQQGMTSFLALSKCQRFFCDEIPDSWQSTFSTQQLQG